MNAKTVFTRFMLTVFCGMLFVAGGLPSAWTQADQSSEESPMSETYSPSELQAMREAFISEFERSPLNTTPGDAQFLRILIESAGCQRGIEVGTATGFGAVNMGMAFEQTGGHLYTIDIDPQMVESARDNISEMALEETVTVIEGDALEVLPQMEGKFDFLFIDAVKQDYFKYFKSIARRLKPGSIIVADNVIRFEEEMKDFLDFMKEDPDYLMQVIVCSEEKGDGMAVIYKAR